MGSMLAYSAPSNSSRQDRRAGRAAAQDRSEEHTSELQSHLNLVCRLLLEKKNHSIRNKNGKLYGRTKTKDERHTRRMQAKKLSYRAVCRELRATNDRQRQQPRRIRQRHEP